MEGWAYRSSTPEQAEVARPDLRVWHDRSKIRGRFIGIGNGVLVAKLNGDGLSNQGDRVKKCVTTGGDAESFEIL
jgi:hypothetical protein